MPFQHDLFGCFDNCGLCVITFFAPCYTFGKVAEAVGENCLLCGLISFVPVANLVFLAINRGKLREQKGIEGDVLNDFLMAWCCGFCALVQEAQEIEVPGNPQIVRG
uniref:Uncharacterized protein n=1 Tax=Arion vulgaris TaxID=1028688 RepID=A0A0B7BSF0_9EUPU